MEKPSVPVVVVAPDEVVAPDGSGETFTLELNGLWSFGGIRVPMRYLDETMAKLKTFIQTADAQLSENIEVDFFDGYITHFYIKTFPPKPSESYHIAFHVDNAETVLKALTQFVTSKQRVEIVLPRP